MFENFKGRLRAMQGGSSLPFESQVAAFKERIAQAAENRKMGANLLFMTTYMASLALANASRPEIFANTSERSEYITSPYIARVDNYVKKWNYSYAESLSFVAERTKNEMLQMMLLRYSNAINSNVPDEEFLNNEIVTVRSAYRGQYEQGFELLTKWGDAYVAMLLAGTVIAVTIMISVAIYSPAGMEGTLNMSYGIIFLICMGGIVLMYQSVPEDPKTHRLPERSSKEQNTIHALEKIIVPVTIILALLLWFLGVPAGFLFIFVGVLVAPLGIIGFFDDHNITMRDNDFTTFIRTLGAVTGGKATTAVYALRAIDPKSFLALEPLIKSVYSKMNLGLDERQIWDRFVGESGSDLIHKYLNIYLDTIRLGGPAEPIGKIVGSSMHDQVLLREKKDMLSRSFFLMLLPMHIVMAGIFIALFRIMVVLTSSVGSMMTHFQAAGATGGAAASGASMNSAISGSLNMFTNFPEPVMYAYVAIILTITTAANIIVAKIVGGGDRYMYYFYTTIFCIMTGLMFLIVPMVVGIFFNPEALTNMAGPGI
ncbi:MAG: archaellar assembly protein FlaJ [Methanoregula sp.]|nr:MAG: archaellar assembly protein FlaJ [Methanoregula sp.]